MLPMKKKSLGVSGVLGLSCLFYKSRSLVVWTSQMLFLQSEHGFGFIKQLELINSLPPPLFMHCQLYNCRRQKEMSSVE